VRSAECRVRNDNGNNERPSPRRTPSTQREAGQRQARRARSEGTAKTADGGPRPEIGQRPGIGIREPASGIRGSRLVARVLTGRLVAGYNACQDQAANGLGAHGAPRKQAREGNRCEQTVTN